jgi:hypothetical protein
LPASTLSGDAVQHVLRQLEREAAPSLVQHWASFMKRGYITGKRAGKITPLDIPYDQAHEDTIVEALTRMDEIGDLIDGELAAGEIAELIERLAA